MDKGDYSAHTAGIRAAADAAIAVVRERKPEHRDGLYVHTMTADGQYWTVIVGVANSHDQAVEVEVDETNGTAVAVPTAAL